MIHSWEHRCGFRETSSTGTAQSGTVLLLFTYERGKKNKHESRISSRNRLSSRSLQSGVQTAAVFFFLHVKKQLNRTNIIIIPSLRWIRNAIVDVWTSRWQRWSKRLDVFIIKKEKKERRRLRFACKVGRVKRAVNFPKTSNLQYLNVFELKLLPNQKCRANVSQPGG